MRRDSGSNINPLFRVPPHEGLLALLHALTPTTGGSQRTEESNAANAAVTLNALRCRLSAREDSTSSVPQANLYRHKMNLLFIRGNQAGYEL